MKEDCVMKKIISLLLAVMMILSLSACSPSYDLSGLSENETIVCQNVLTVKSKTGNHSSFSVLNDEFWILYKTTDKGTITTISAVTYKASADAPLDTALFENGKFVINYSERDTLDQNNPNYSKITNLLSIAKSITLSIDPFSIKYKEEGYTLEYIDANTIKEKLYLK